MLLMASPWLVQIPNWWSAINSLMWNGSVCSNSQRIPSNTALNAATSIAKCMSRWCGCTIRSTRRVEINSTFAKGFVKEFSSVVIASGAAMKFNWAEFVVHYLQDLQEKDYYEGHVNKWRMRNSQHQIPKHENEMWEDNLGCVRMSNAKSTKPKPLSHHSTQWEAESLSFFDLEDLQRMKAIVLHLRTQV